MAKREKKKPEERRKSRRVRVNMRLPDALVVWVREYAECRNTTVTQVVVDRLTELQAENTA
jgi:hypothetical protein